MIAPPMSVYLRNEGKERVRKSELPLLLPDEVWGAPDRYPILHGIDIDGNTILNIRQTERMVSEIRLLLSEGSLSDSERASLEAVIAMCESDHIPPHHFVWILGR